MTISFVDERINDNEIVRGSAGGPVFNTQVLRSRSGVEQRNVIWTYPLSKWEVGQRDLTQTQLDAINTFFRARLGKAVGFRFKDWGDYTCNSSQGIVQGVTVGGVTSYQLFKRYTSTTGVVQYRQILKPVSSTFVLYRNSTAINQFSLNSDGTLSLGFTPVATDTLTWSGQFDVPVRFDTDELRYQFKGYNPTTSQGIFSLYSLPVIELRNL